MQGDRFGQAVDRVGRASMLAVLVVDVDLDQYIQRCAVVRAVTRQQRNQFGAVHRLHPIEALARQFGLVGLQVADQMPFQVQRTQLGDLGVGFLHVVFAKGALALRGQGGNGVGRLGLGDRQQPHVGTRVCGRCGVDGIENLLQRRSRHVAFRRRRERYSAARRRFHPVGGCRTPASMRRCCAHLRGVSGSKVGDRPQVRPRPGATDWQCGPLRSGKRCARQQALDATAHQPFGLGPFRSRAQATVSARRVAPDLNRRQAASRRQPERYTAVRGVPSNRSLGEKQRMDIAELLAFSVKNKHRTCTCLQGCRR
ncbi:hypothetical protein XAC1083_530039 [Xanthomonas citri pv. citri]|nr:hypothetical protein XAC1083_530039 [Xanthomonas citri pv. citri]